MLNCIRPLASIQFTNTLCYTNIIKTSFSLFRKEETIAWTTAQIHCQEVISHHHYDYQAQKNTKTLTQTDITSGSTSFVANIGNQNVIISS